MADAFDEVEERIREERLGRLFKAGWPWALAAFLLALLGLVGWNQYREWRVTRGQDAAIAMAAAREQAQQGEPDAAAAAFATAAERAPGELEALALMERADALIAADRVPEAREALEAAEAAGKDPIVKHAAALKAAYLAADDLDFAALEARLEPLLEDDAPYVFLARELLAMEALDGGDADRARKDFQFLAAALDTPEGVRTRAQAALQLLGPAPEPSGEAAASSPESAAKTAPGAAE